MTLHDADTRPAEPAEAEPLRPPTPGGFSIKPAMIVLGLAVLILAAFVTLGIVSSHSPAPVKTSGPPSAVAGSPLRSEPAADALKPIVGSGDPPSNIINAVTVPVGSIRISHQNNAAGAGQFDAQVTLRSTDSQGALLAFSRRPCIRRAGRSSTRGQQPTIPARSRFSGSWRAPTATTGKSGRPSSRPSSVTASPAAGETDFTIRLLQQNDDQS